MIDLDEIERAAKDADNPSAEIPRTVLTLVAELRAAREAAAALALLVDHFADQEALAGSPLLCARRALAAYDQVVGT